MRLIDRSPRAALRLTAALAPALAALLAALPHRADACGASLPGLVATDPAAGATYPANAALRFDGFDLSLTGVTATIDGEPATLVPAEPSGAPGLFATLEPQPQPGQTVTIAGAFCEFEECEAEEFSFTAGPPDLDAPVAKDVFFTAFDHGGFVSSGADCMGDADLALYLHADLSPQADGQAPVRYRVTFDPDAGAPEPPGFVRNGLFDVAGPSARSTSLTADKLGAVAAADVCLLVEFIDFAGNAGEPIEVCKPCFLRVSDELPETDTPEEPTWSDADIVPGSACAGPDETGTGTDSDTDDTGAATDSSATGEATDSSATGEQPTTGEPTTTGEPPATGGESTAGETANEQPDGDKGCGCRGDGGAGGSLALLAGLLALVRRRR